MTSTFSFQFTVGQKFYNGRYEVIKVTPSFVTFQNSWNYEIFRRKPIEIAPHYYEDIDGQMRLSVVSYKVKIPTEDREFCLEGNRFWLDKEHCDGWMTSLLRTAPAPPRPPRVVRQEPTPAQRSIQEARQGPPRQIPVPPAPRPNLPPAQ